MLPDKLQSVVLAIPGGRLCHRLCSAFVDRLCYKPNPVLQTIYLVLVMGGFLIYLVFGSHLVPNPRLGIVHSFLPFFVVNMTLLSFILASKMSPGYVTSKNQAALERIYPLDGFIFVKRQCETCGVDRVARSKHCKMVGRCVEKYDHFW